MNSRDNDTLEGMIGQIYDATPVNSDVYSVNVPMQTELSDEEGILSEESDLEGQFGIIQKDSLNEATSVTQEYLVGNVHTNEMNISTVPTLSYLSEKSKSFCDIKVHVHCGDVMYPSYTGALISLHNSNTEEVFLHGDFGDRYFKDDEFLDEGVDLIALIQHGREVCHEETELGTIVDSSSM